MSSEIVEVECALCGLEGGPSLGCDTCHGNGGTQKAAHTLSDLRRNPDLQERRSGLGAEVGPKSITLPGSRNY